MYFLQSLSLLLFILSKSNNVCYGQTLIPSIDDGVQPLEQLSLEDSSSGSHLNSIPNDVLRSKINSRLHFRDLMRFSQSSKHFHQQTSEERAAWKRISRACGLSIASSLKLWNKKRPVFEPVWPLLPTPWFLGEVPTKECVESWRSLCSLDSIQSPIPMFIRGVRTLHPDLMSILPSCFEVEGVTFVTYRLFPHHHSMARGMEESWDLLMKRITPSEGPLLPSQKIHSLYITIGSAEYPLSLEQEDRFLDFLGHPKSSLQVLKLSQYVFSTSFAEGLAHLLKKQRGPAELHLLEYSDVLNPDFLPTILDALKVNHSLKVLSIMFSRLSQRSITALMDMISKNQSIVELRVSECGIHEDDILALVKASLNHPGLKVLDVSQYELSYQLQSRLKRMVSNANKSIIFSA